MSRSQRVEHASRRLAGGVLFLISLGFAPGCHSARPDYGTLPTVVVPFGGEGSREDVTPVPPQQTKLSPEPVVTDLPDPKPLSTTHQFDFIVDFNKGEVSVASSERIELALAAPSSRRLGRFAFELWNGAQLIERVRFDFPLLGAGAPADDDVMEKGLTTQAKVRIPETSRANSARILDRKTRNVVNIPWPPAEESLAE